MQNQEHNWFMSLPKKELIKNSGSLRIQFLRIGNAMMKFIKKLK